MAEIDWASIEQAVPSKRTCYDFDKYQSYFYKVAFDCYKANNGSEQLWELRDGDDGRKYLFALYEEPEDVVTSSKDWEAQPDQEGKSITLSYKKIPIYRFASEQFRFTPQQAGEFAEFISKKAENKDWIQKLLSDAMSDERRSAVSKLLAGDI